MHSESMKDQEALEEILTDMRKRAAEREDVAAVGYIDNIWGFSRKHTAIVEKFGRYPHRNQCLGRKTTREEKEWLENGGDTFGT